MTVRLLHPDRDPDRQRPLPWGAETCMRDLALKIPIEAMSGDDPYLFAAAQQVILSSPENDAETIRFRQGVLQDCLRHPEPVRELYAIAAAASGKEKRHYLGIPVYHPDWVLRDSIEALEFLFDAVRQLRRTLDAHGAHFVSEGWTALCANLQTELSDDVLDRVASRLEQLKFHRGIMLGAELGPGNQGQQYALLDSPSDIQEGWLGKLFRRREPVQGFSLDPRDEAGIRALGELQNRGIAPVATLLARAADHVRALFAELRFALAFYTGCLNLHHQLLRLGVPVCFPEPIPMGERRLSFRGLCDAALALQSGRRPVANDAAADRRSLVFVTGANQGGKSTFLRSLGAAQLWMQSGMFVPADAYRASLCDGLFTHYKREEDAAMQSGKLDEELGRMSEIVSHLTPHPMILFNESFAATNEREGSEIARQVLSALADHGARIVCVTHLYELAHGFYQRDRGAALFLRAERGPEGTRSFRLVEGEPLPTSFGEDVYRGIFESPQGDTDN